MSKFMDWIESLSKIKRISLTFTISVIQAFLLFMIAGLSAGSPFLQWNWIGFLINIISLSITMLLTVKLAISTGEEPEDPFTDTD
jgi:hypothetical protein